MRAPLVTLGLVGLLGLANAAGCATERETSLARASQARDFDTYRLRRVGLLPFAGVELPSDHAHALQDGFLHELSRAAPWEVVALSTEDLAEVAPSEPYRRGAYLPRTILELSRRFQLDGLLVGTVTQAQAIPPQSLSLELDLVAVETGLVIWSSSVQLDGSEAHVRQRLASYEAALGGAPGTSDEPGLALLSPSRFARFAAHEVASSL